MCIRDSFYADKRHLHHLLLKLNYSHLQAAAILVTSNFCCLVFAIILQTLGLDTLSIMFWLLFIGIIASFSLYRNSLTIQNQKNMSVEKIDIEEGRQRKQRLKRV